MILGCAQPEGEQGWNLARMAALRAGLAGGNSRRHREPALRLGTGGDCDRRSAHPLRRRAGDCCRRSRIDEPDSHGRQQAQPQSMARGQLSRVAAHHGPDGRARRPPLRNLARRSGRLCPRESPEGSGRAGCGAIRRRDGSGTRDEGRARRARSRESRRSAKRNFPPTKARAPTRPPPHWRSSSRCFMRRARSLRATPRKPPTAQRLRC